MNRKWLYIILSVLLIGAALLHQVPRQADVNPGQAQAAHPAQEWSSTISAEVNRKKITLLVDGAEAVIQERLFMDESRGLLLPLSAFSQALGCYVGEMPDQSIIIQGGETCLRLEPGSTEMQNGDQTVSLSSPVRRRNDITYVPAEVLELGFGCECSWQKETRMLSINTPEAMRQLPLAYDYRLQGRAPQIKDQGSFGTCWAFASLTALESAMLPDVRLDLSEEHMSLNSSFDVAQLTGGKYSMALAYLTAWQGPVFERDDPYGDGMTDPTLPEVLHVQEVQLLPSKDIQAIKNAVFYRGGVQTSLYMDMGDANGTSPYYNAQTAAYCYIGTSRINHDVVIVGWDDAYPKENFAVQPEENGAFLCQNSWGQQFGMDGYFYVSYYDSNIGIYNLLYSGVEKTDNYDKLYQTDLCGWVGQIGYGSESAYFANVYEAGSRTEELAACGFYATGANTSYEVSVIRSWSGEGDFKESRPLAAGTLANSGYYTIPFTEPIALEPGETFAIVVHIFTPGASQPVAVEYADPDSPETAGVILEDGKGYTSYRGYSWNSAEEESAANICLKAYTRYQ